ncbi:transcription factor bHLH93-like [Solanum dulcamara]|uniref:transcription factor bHLH93-like n=1 Tax=Solanum dulcamara TaxID=45834 RepID=UPI002485E626|nr:transcription factor bHLH93-like [Solanum dulcamara]
MEDYYSENGFLLDELFALRSDLWESTCLPMEMNGSNFNCINNYGCFEETPLHSTTTTTTSFEDYHNNLPIDQSQNSSFLLSEFYSTQQVDELSPLHSFISPFTSQLEDFSSIFEDEKFGDCKLERTQSTVSSAAIAPTNFNIDLCPDKKAKTKKANGEPSKNLMAERRRRKRLNGRLSMLRSIVPKISKMDRMSILRDTIDYTKELLEKINNLQEEMKLGSNQLSLMSIFKNEKPIEMFIRNSPKFNVERNNIDTRVEINCAGKSSLLLSTLTKLEALGLEPQQCIISCFNDFAMQASFNEKMEQRGVTNAEEIKQALFRNAGYAGKCL